MTVYFWVNAEMLALAMERQNNKFVFNSVTAPGHKAFFSSVEEAVESQNTENAEGTCTVHYNILVKGTLCANFSDIMTAIYHGDSMSPYIFKIDKVIRIQDL